MKTTQPIEPDFDQGAIGYALRFTGECLLCPWSVPAITSAALAEELREMLALELPSCTVGILYVGLFSGEIAMAVDLTERMRARVIAARDAESPGYEFLRGIGWHPEKKLSEADYAAAHKRSELRA